jgi:hypothetical protein
VVVGPPVAAGVHAFNRAGGNPLRWQHRRLWSAGRRRGRGGRGGEGSPGGGSARQAVLPATNHSAGLQVDVGVGERVVVWEHVQRRVSQQPLDNFQLAEPAAAHAWQRTRREQPRPAPRALCCAASGTAGEAARHARPRRPGAGPAGPPRRTGKAANPTWERSCPLPRLPALGRTGRPCPTCPPAPCRARCSA